MDYETDEELHNHLAFFKDENPLHRFTITWFYRALAKREIDIGDRFICLWICFNSIIRKTYGENLKDSDLIDKVAESYEWRKALEEVMDEHLEIEIKSLSELLPIKNMKTGKPLINKRTKRPFDKNDNLTEFSNLIRIIYAVRCNLFHGRKYSFDYEGSKDFKLIKLCYLIFTPIMEFYLSDNKLLMGNKSIHQKRNIRRC